MIEDATINEPIHVYPSDDWYEHILEDDQCTCKPTTETHENGTSQIIHYSFDGREHLEPDHDWRNCKICQEDIANLETTTGGW